MKYAPGPWCRDYVYSLLRYGTRSFEFSSDCDCLYVPSEDDADLVVAAPEMLEILKEIQECAVNQNDCDVPQELVNRLDAVIKKATGEK